IEALESDFTYVIVATASGGVYKSVNAGTTWEPIFDNYGAASIGDVAISEKDPNIIWIGTGEECCRNSIAWGDGVYKSVDGGKTFQNMGLKDTHAIGTIIIHPKDPDKVYVAAAGHLWGYSGDRGLYRTEDGGLTWEKLTNGLPDDGKTGAIELVMDPKDSDNLYVAFWERLRQPYRFDSGGPNGGIFKSTNGGKSWDKLTKGLPEGPTGKIGIAVYKKNPKIVMAMVEHGFQPGRNDPDYNDMSKLGTGLYRSENGGKDWKYINRSNSRPFYYSHIWMNPLDDQIVYWLASGFSISYDGGETFEGQSLPVHGDHHALWLDPTNQKRFYLGNDGGASLTQDHGETYEFYDNLIAAQFYAVAADMRDPYWVWGGLQDNGTWGGPSKVRDPNGILTDHWVKVGGGDGFHAQCDPTDWRTIYFESQGGALRRHNPETGQSQTIRPGRNNIINYDQYITPEIEETEAEKGNRGGIRFNWSSPIHLSPHNPEIVFFAGNYLFKSVDKGDSWTIISPDLTKNDPIKTRRETGGLTQDATGAETHGTIITISESPITPGIIWVGTDDGNIQMTRNSGVSWENVRTRIREVPDDIWVSRVEASHFEAGTAYVSFDGHRSDVFTPWVFKTTDFGRTWQNVSGDLPDGQVIYVVKEDLKNPNLLFVGTEFACFATINGGNNWTKLNNGLPTVAVHDLVIHPRDNDLIAATHGRGIFIMDDITALQQLTDEVVSSDAALLDQRVFTNWARIQKSDPRKGHQFFSGENYNSSMIPLSYYIGSGARGDVMLEITNLQGRKHTAILDNVAGLGRYMWNKQFDAPMNPATIQSTIDNLTRVIALTEEPELKTQLESVLREYRNAPTDAHRNKALRGIDASLLRGMGGGRGGRGGGFGGRGGGSAGPGEYAMKMTVNGETFTTKLIIREDPIMNNR
ncbi:WD40/YVTN/BNR-like repeat-containing protein, partial [candidate division KSB1 bacterium]